MNKIITELKKDNASGLDNLTAEHLQLSHPIVVSVSKPFTIMMSYGYFPASFGRRLRSYSISLPKGNAIKALIVDDFRGLSISPVLSKIFKH